MANRIPHLTIAFCLTVFFAGLPSPSPGQDVLPPSMGTPDDYVSDAELNRILDRLDKKVNTGGGHDVIPIDQTQDDQSSVAKMFSDWADSQTGAGQGHAPAAAGDAAVVASFEPSGPDQRPEFPEGTFKNTKIVIKRGWSLGARIDQGLGEGWQPVSPNNLGIRPNDVLYVPAGGKMTLVTEQGATMTLVGPTELAFTNVSVNDSGNQLNLDMNLRNGGVEWHRKRPSRSPNPMRGRVTIKTTRVTVESSHTRFKVIHQASRDVTLVIVTEGFVNIRPTNPQLEPRRVQAGELVAILSDKILPAAASFAGLSIPDRTIRPRRTALTVPLRLDNVRGEGAEGLGNLNVEIHYDPSVISISKSITKGNLIASGILFKANAKEKGVIYLGCAGPRGITSNGTIAQIPLTIEGRSGLETKLRIVATQAQTPTGTSLRLPVTHGKISVSTTSGAPAGSTNPDSRIPRADSDGDGRLTPRDAALALKMSVGLVPMNLEQDFSGNGRVQSEDARLILQNSQTRR